MSTNVQKKSFHLTSECRSIFYRLMLECAFQLDKDITEGFEHPSCSLGNLLPLIYQAFIKIWCKKITLICRKSVYTQVGINDIRSIRIPYATFQTLLKEHDVLRGLLGYSNEHLPS